MFAAVLRAIFAIILGVLLVGDALICNMLLLTPEAILSKRTTEGLALVITHYVFAVAMLLCPWIQISSDGDLSATWREVLGHITSTSDNRPVFLIGNHTSFLDTVLCVAKTPFMLTWNARTYVSNGLLSMPLLGTVIKAMGLFTVQFKGVKDGDFSVDKEKMAKMQVRVDAHIQNGGVLCFFPEGQVNSNPEKIMPFRYGGMKVALDNDAKIYQYVTCGCPSVWKKKEPVGGWPGKVIYGLKPLAPQGTKQLLQDVRAQKLYPEDKPDVAVLAEYFQAKMQSYYDELVIKGGIIAKPKSD